MHSMIFTIKTSSIGCDANAVRGDFLLQDNSFAGIFILHNKDDIEIAGHIFPAVIMNQCKIICLIEHTFNNIADLAGAGSFSV